MFTILNCCLIFIISCVHGENIQFFGDTNYTKLVWESNSTKSCNNISTNEVSIVYSIRTDACFIIYSFWDCRPYLSEKYIPGDTTVPPDGLGRSDPILSFQACNKEEGGNQLNLDIVKYPVLNSQVLPDVLESYKNVCSCVNVPGYVQNMSKWSIDNHHNSLLAYYEPDCSESKLSAKFIAGGMNSDSNYMHRHKKTDIFGTGATHKIMSLGPDPNSSYFQFSCMKSTRKLTMENQENAHEITTKSTCGLSDGINKRFQVLTNQIADLHTEQKNNFDKLVKIIALLQHEVGSLTSKMLS